MPASTETGADSTLLRLSLELRQLTRQVRDPEASERPLVRGLAQLLTGDLAAAARELGAESRSASTPPAAWESLAVRLATRLVDVIMEPSDAAAGQFEEIMLSAEVDGWPLLSRLARSLQTAILLATAPAPWRISAAAELLDDLERRDDRWTVCVTSLAIGAAYAWIDQPALATRTLGGAEDVAGELGAPVLQAWAGVLRSTTWRSARANPKSSGRSPTRYVPQLGWGCCIWLKLCRQITMRAGHAATGRPTEVTSSAEVRLIR